jgi:transcription elongation factor Elf1
MRICNEPACKKKRYDSAYGRLVSIVSVFDHKGGIRSNPATRPMLLTLPFADNQPIKKDRKRKEEKCIREMIKYFELKGVRVYEAKYNKNTKLSHDHVHLLCDNKFIRKRDFSNKWAELTKKIIGKSSKVTYVERVTKKFALNYMSARLGFPLIQTYKKNGSVRKNRVILRQYLDHIKDQHFLTVFGFNQEKRREIKSNYLKKKKDNPSLVCKICGKPYRIVAVCLSSELDLYLKPEKKLEVIEHVPSVSYILISEINGGET